MQQILTESVNPKRLRLFQSMHRSEPFASQYFDFQDAHKRLFELEDGNRLETSFYVHLRRDSVVDVAVDIATMIGSVQWVASSVLLQ